MKTVVILRFSLLGGSLAISRRLRLCRTEMKCLLPIFGVHGLPYRPLGVSYESWALISSASNLPSAGIGRASAPNRFRGALPSLSFSREILDWSCR